MPGGKTASVNARKTMSTNDTISVGTMKTNKTDIHRRTIAAPIVIKKGVVSDTVMILDDAVAIDAIGVQIAVEVGAAVEAAAGVRPKIVITNADRTTTEAVAIAAAAATQKPKPPNRSIVPSTKSRRGHRTHRRPEGIRSDSQRP